MSVTEFEKGVVFHTRTQWMVHILFWVVYAWINYMLAFLLIGNTSFAAGFVIVTLITHATLVYFHLLFLLPHYFEAQDYHRYAIFLVVAIGGIALLRLLGLEGVSDYAQLDREPPFALKVGVSLGSSFIVLLITTPFYFLPGWLQKRTEPVAVSTDTEEPEEPSYFFIRSENKLVKIFFADITHVESLRDLVRIHTATGRHLSQHSMRKMMEILPAEQFVRVHRTYIIAFDKIAAVSGNVIELVGHRIPVGKTYKQAFFSRLEVL